MDNYLEQLNEQQRRAVLYCGGPQLVIAGAGSGKTRVLTYKVVHLLNQGFEPWRIMALTFTNKAAREMRDRIEPLVGDEVARQLWMGTFHSIFARLLRINASRLGFRSDFTIYDTADSRSLIKLIVRDMELDDKVYKPATLQSVISTMKNALISPDDYAADSSLIEADLRAKRPQTQAIYRAYCERCRVAGAMDFDDLLYYTNVMLRDHSDLREKYQQAFRYILVDEYQDTNFAQHMIVLQLTREHNRLCVVGDDAQSIYSFRGANVDNILTLSKSYPGLRTDKLEQNYRSTQTIINAANSLIAVNSRQIAKHLYSENAVGAPIEVVGCYSDYEEAYVVANRIASIKARQGDRYDDFAVLYRTNAQSRVLEEALSNGGRRDKHGNVRDAIPYRIYGGLSFYQRKEIKDAVCYFRLAINPHDDEALRRVINTPARGIGDTTVGRVQHCAIEHGVSMWQVMCDPEKHLLKANSGTKRKLVDFVAMIDEFRLLDKRGVDAFTLARAIIDRTRLLAVLMGDKTPENISRQENLNELLSALRAFVDGKLEQGLDDTALGDFLAEVSLLTDQDTDDTDGDKVTLMTVHAAKGLEFKNVIIVGMEEDLFPASMSADSARGIEEERRLCYVAITRAKNTCLITHAGSRYRNGQTFHCVPSRFLSDIDPQYLRTSATGTGSRTTSRSGGNDVDLDGERTKWLSPDDDTPLITANPSPRLINSIAKPTGSPSSASSMRATPRRSASTTAGAGFTKHTAADLHESQRVVHSVFGQGTVVTIDTTGSDDKAIIDFDNEGRKTLLLKFAKLKLI